MKLTSIFAAIEYIQTLACKTVSALDAANTLKFLVAGICLRLQIDETQARLSKQSN